MCRKNLGFVSVVLPCTDQLSHGLEIPKQLQFFDIFQCFSKDPRKFQVTTGIPHAQLSYHASFRMLCLPHINCKTSGTCIFTAFIKTARRQRNKKQLRKAGMAERRKGRVERGVGTERLVSPLSRLTSYRDV